MPSNVSASLRKLSVFFVLMAISYYIICASTRCAVVVQVKSWAVTIAWNSSLGVDALWLNWTRSRERLYVGVLASISLSAESVPTVIITAIRAANSMPTPIMIPIEAVIHMDADVVSPRMVSTSRRMTPTPKKPMPVMMP